MHVAVSWDISATGDRWNTINDSMREVLKPYSWVRPLTTFYVVKLAATSDRDRIVEQLTEIARTTEERTLFLVTPIMAPGPVYQGWLPKKTWDDINERTEK